jgi:hypothetical protein
VRSVVIGGLITVLVALSWRWLFPPLRQLRRLG